MTSLLDPQSLITSVGLIGLLVIVFAESGLLIGFFLPGDSLLFTTGLLVAGGVLLHTPLWLVCLLVSIAAAAGDQVGYLLGRRFGPSLFRRPDSRFFKRENLMARGISSIGTGLGRSCWRGLCRWCARLHRSWRGRAACTTGPSSCSTSPVVCFGARA
jgi:membrane protein DedA with SNARE-associated domain